MSVQPAIEALALRFAQDVVAILRGELLAGAARSAAVPKKARAPSARTATPRKATSKKGARIDYAEVSAEVVAALKKQKGGLRSEALQKTIRRDKREVFPVLKKLLAAKKIRKTGQKRATKYFAQ